jgi:hypothetical protein
MTLPATWPVWWQGDQFDGSASVLRCEPYRGLYPQWFTHSLRLRAPNTKSGYLEMAVNLDKDFRGCRT